MKFHAKRHALSIYLRECCLQVDFRKKKKCKKILRFVERILDLLENIKHFWQRCYIMSNNNNSNWMTAQVVESISSNIIILYIVKLKHKENERPVDVLVFFIFSYLKTNSESHRKTYSVFAIQLSLFGYNTKTVCKDCFSKTHVLIGVDFGSLAYCRWIWV